MQPPSTMKRSSFAPSTGHVRSASASRPSLMLSRPSQPIFQPSSSAANVAEIGMCSVKRSSQNASASKQYTPGGPSAPDSERRSSVYVRPSMAGSVGHQSFFQQAPQPAGVPRDPRPLKDRSYQARLGQELLEYASKHNFEVETSHQLSPNFLKSPTQKDFNAMFKWLYHRIDPNYWFQKNIDQEVPPLLKQLRYPFERGITKSQISAVGGQNWYTFLGLLHWMMQLSVMLERYARHQYNDACLEAGVDVTGDHVVFDFLVGSYNDFLNMDDSSTEEDVKAKLAPRIDVLAQAFEQANARYFQELDILERENERLQGEIDELEKTTPDPATLDNHFKIMEEDRFKFEEYMDVATQRAEKYEARIDILQEELDKLHADLHETEDERRRLQKSVDDQGISMQDIDRMNAERDRLQKGIESATQRLEDMKRKVGEKEVEANGKLEDLERLVDKYNTLAYQIDIIPSTAVNAKGKEFELQVTVNDGPNFTSSQLQGSQGGGGLEGDRLLADPVTGYQPARVLNLDLRGSVKNSFLALRREVSERRRMAMEAIMQHQDMLESAKEALEDKRNEVEALEHRVRAAEEEYEKTKEVTTAQKLASDAQIERMEKQLAEMRAQLSESVQLMEQREMNINIEYEQLSLRANALREELHTEVMRMLNDVIKFKMHVQKNLEDFETFVADELEQELGSEELRDDTQSQALEL